MKSFITSCILLMNTMMPSTAAEALPLKIISPLANSSLQIGACVNVTVEIPLSSIPVSKDIVLGLLLNSTNANGTLLGLFNTTAYPFPPKTGQLSCSFEIPARERYHQNSTSYSLVISRCEIYGSTCIPAADLASVPVILIGSHNSTSAKPSPVKSGAEVVEIPKSEVNASIIAKGHNTGDTIPHTAVPGQLTPVTNTNSSVAVSKPPPYQSATNLTTHQLSPSGNNEATPNASSATRIGISAVLCVITTLSIFSVAI